MIYVICVLFSAAFGLCVGGWMKSSKMREYESENAAVRYDLEQLRKDNKHLSQELQLAYKALDELKQEDGK